VLHNIALVHHITIVLLRLTFLALKREAAPDVDGLLALAVLSDKIVQRATVTLLNAIYEEDLLGFLCGRHA
jgi:hypothetical protein